MRERSANGSIASVLACPNHVQLGGNLGSVDCPILPVEGERDFKRPKRGRPRGSVARRGLDDHLLFDIINISVIVDGGLLCRPRSCRPRPFAARLLTRSCTPSAGM